MRKILVLILMFFIFFGNTLLAEDLTVRIYAEKTITKFTFASVSGNYKLSDENHRFIIDVPKDKEVQLSIDENKIALHFSGKLLGRYAAIVFDGEGEQPIFEIRPEDGKAESRYYDDHLDIIIEKQAFRIINTVELEKYVAGVIQSEVLGSSDDVDFFKIQAIISRTYALNNILKHFTDGYQLCDGVHCQAYKSRNNTPKIAIAVQETSGLVIVDESNKMISAAFHSNSGGETVNSEDAWSTPTPYLKSVSDTFSLSMRNTTWQKIYDVNEWLNFLEQTYQYDIQDPNKRALALNFNQESRKKYFHEFIPLKNMRKDMNLKSTFFSVRQENDQVILEGRGYGHGVGLSQEGAIRMIQLGYSVEDVLSHYYQNTSLVHIEELTADDGITD